MLFAVALELKAVEEQCCHCDKVVWIVILVALPFPVGELPVKGSIPT